MVMLEQSRYQGLSLFHSVSTQSSLPFANPSSFFLLFMSFGLHEAFAQFRV